MISEIKAAVEWITRTMEINELSDSQLQRFEWALVEALTRKYTDHWYQDMPWRGQGYRSILSEDCEHVVDHVLRHAAREANITDLPYRMPAEAFVIWVDPGDVEVRFLKSHRTEVLYHQPSLHHPYVADSSSASTHRRSFAATMSPVPASLEDSGRFQQQPQRQHNGYSSRVRSLDAEVDVDGGSSLLLPDDEQGLRYKNGHHQQQHDYLNASDSAVLISRQTSPPPRGGNVWNGSGSYTNKSPSKFNLHARPWERPSPAAPSWGAGKTGLRSVGVGLAGVV
jgi:protein Tob/BTG